MEKIIGNKWDEILKNDFESDYFAGIRDFVESEYEKQTVFPERENVFRAFKSVDFDNVKVVILGQDPYHEAGQANGLAFAVYNGVKRPPSLVNIFKEIENEYGESPESSDLRFLAEQGVLLLNTVLTVREGMAQSHSKCGWQHFTDNVISYLGKRSCPTVFILWGANAWKKEQFIDSSRHLVLKSAHPSPLSAYRGFFGCNHFKNANDFLLKKGLEPVDWTGKQKGRTK